MRNLILLSFLLVSFNLFAQVRSYLHSSGSEFEISSSRETCGHTFEWGETADPQRKVEYGIKLDSEPTSEVTFDIEIDDPTEGLASTDTLTFTPDNWNEKQIVTIFGVDDLIDEYETSYHLIIKSRSSDEKYNSYYHKCRIKNLDNDQAGIRYVLDTYYTTEAGREISVGVHLSTMPKYDVTIRASIDSDEAEVIGTQEQVVTAENWKQVQNFKVKGKDDDVADGHQQYQVKLTFVSKDSNYNTEKSLTLTNKDDGDASKTGVKVVQNGTQTSEDGGEISFDVVLGTEPENEVEIAISTKSTDEVSFPVSVIYFNSTNWDQVQTLKVVGKNDDLADGNKKVVVSLDAKSTDDSYNNNIGNYEIFNVDNDKVELLLDYGELVTDESGDKIVRVKATLSMPPVRSYVSVNTSSSDYSEGSAGGAVSFSKNNWNVPQEIIIKGNRDYTADGDVEYKIKFVTSASFDPGFNNISRELTITNIDTDDAKGD